MTAESKGRDLFIVDNSVSGWTGLRYLEEWSGIAKAFDIATGYFEIGALLAGNANYAWVQHFIHHLAPTGLAGFVLANGSMSSNQSGEGEFRKAQGSAPSAWPRSCSQTMRDCSLRAHRGAAPTHA